MRDYLEADGHTVLVANDGAAAVEAVAEHDVQCVLLDVMMPELSGFDVLRRIRERSDVPVLMLSALGSANDKLLGHGLGPPEPGRPISRERGCGYVYDTVVAG